MPKKSPTYHPENQSPFFRLRTKKKLADLLFCSKEKLKDMSGKGDYYYSFPKPKKDGGNRNIDAPREDLKKIQKRIAELLQKIVPPDFLFAPVTGRSYVDNAAHHLGARSIRLLDIEDFFPSCTAERVIWFFHKRMECSLDVAVILKNLLTKDGVLPQGSPCSPILAYLSYVDMWEEINQKVEQSKCTLSVYADDLTISGDIVPEATIWGIKKLLKKYGHNIKIKKERSIRDKTADITGVVLKKDKLLLPNRQHQKLVEVRGDLKKERSPAQRKILTNKVRGRESQAKQIEQHSPKAIN